MILRVVLFRKGGNLVFYYGRMDFPHKTDETIEQDLTYDYGNVMLIKRCIGVEDFLQMTSSKKITISGIPVIDLNDGFQDGWDQICSKSHEMSLYSDWPTTSFRYFGNNQGQSNYVYDTLVKVGLPTYPSMYDASQSFLNLDRKPDFNSNPGILILIPDYNARINMLEIEDNNIKVSVEKRETEYEALVMKLFCKGHKADFTSSDIELDKNGIMSVDLSFIPDEVHAYLMDKKSGDVVDYRTYGPYARDTSEGIIVRTSQETIESFLANGEGQNVEFKKELSNEFLETIVSFANTNDGVILLGVDNRNKVVGFFDDFDKVQKKIRGMIAGNCEPSNIEIIIEQKEVDHRQIIIIKVKEGNEKPYMLKEKGPYVRIDEKDIVMSRFDLDKIYQQRHQNNQFSRGLGNGFGYL
ncbi:MAG: AlbA family DNA-binding domain-containing protein [Nitrosotalea sp.]